MPGYNICASCKRVIETRKPQSDYLAQRLEESSNAVCDDCEPTSDWTLAGITLGETEGRIGEWRYRLVFVSNRPDPSGISFHGPKVVYVPFSASRKVRKTRIGKLPQDIQEICWRFGLFPSEGEEAGQSPN
jgi:hypothetical protein